MSSYYEALPIYRAALDVAVAVKQRRLTCVEKRDTTPESIAIVPFADRRRPGRHHTVFAQHHNGIRSGHAGGLYTLDSVFKRPCQKVTRQRCAADPQKNKRSPDQPSASQQQASEQQQQCQPGRQRQNRQNLMQVDVQ